MEKENEIPTLIARGFSMESHAPNEICVLPPAGLPMCGPSQHVWKGSLLNWS